MAASVAGSVAGTAAGPAPAVVPVGAETPPGTAQVRAAIRLGWFVAEVRGRHWWRGQHPRSEPVPVDPPDTLPLRPERTAAESRGAARATVTFLAVQLGVARRPADPDGPTFPGDLQRLAGSLEQDGGRLLEPPAPGAPATETALRDAAWTSVAQLLHEWDAAIQDSFTARSDVLANGYLLGRGLAECFWAMAADVDAPPAVPVPRPAPGGAGPERAGTVPPGTAPTRADAGPPASSWEFLFGSARRGELSRLAGRVGPYLPALTPTAVAGSLQVWGEVAGNPSWRVPDGVPVLYEQYRRWYELVVLGREPTTFVQPYALLRGWRTTLRSFRGLWPQLLVGLLSAAAVTAVAYFLATDQGTAWLTTVLAFAGTVGLTASGVAAKAKSTGQQMVTRLRQDAYSDLVAVAVTVVPPWTAGERAGSRATERRVNAAVRRRHVTPVTPQPDLCDPG